MKKRLSVETKAGATIVLFYVLWGLCWPIYSIVLKGSFHLPYIPSASIERDLFLPFTHGHLLGTDIYGRSLLEVLTKGLGYSLSVSVLVSFLSSSIGLLVGFASAYGNTTCKFFFETITNIVFIFPSILIAILIMSVTGQSLAGLIFSLVVTGWPGYAKIARGETLRIKNLGYVESERAIGVGHFRLFYRTLLPTLLPVFFVHIVLGLSGVIMSEAALGFLGLGGSEYSWGVLLSMAKTVLLEAPHIVVIISVTMSGLIVGLNLLGDGLRDYFDPRKSF